MDDVLLSKAFDVGDIPDDFDPTIIPATAEEYIQLVKYEASKCPDIVVADLGEKKIKNQVDLMKFMSDEKFSIIRSDLAPSLEWQQAQIALFSDVRRRVELCMQQKKTKAISLPKPQCEELWQKICGGEDNLDYHEPTLQLLLSMAESLRIQLLEYHGQWLDNGLARSQAKWIYALLACLNIPLMPETCSTLRVLATKCAKLRSTRSSQYDSDVVSLNLIICLVSKYFGQADLGD